MTFYVAANDKNPGFLEKHLGYFAGAPKICPSLRHARSFDSYAEADEAANRAGLVCYTILSPVIEVQR